MEEDTAAAGTEREPPPQLCKGMSKAVSCTVVATPHLTMHVKTVGASARPYSPRLRHMCEVQWPWLALNHNRMIITLGNVSLVNSSRSGRHRDTGEECAATSIGLSPRYHIGPVFVQGLGVMPRLIAESLSRRAAHYIFALPCMYLYIYIYIYICEGCKTLCINNGVADSQQRSCLAS